MVYPVWLAVFESSRRRPLLGHRRKRNHLINIFVWVLAVFFPRVRPAALRTIRVVRAQRNSSREDQIVRAQCNASREDAIQGGCGGIPENRRQTVIRG
jgi:hypothetical protein